VPSSVPRQSNGAYRLFLLHPLWPSPSLQRLGICHLPAGSLWVVCVFGAATFALCYGPVGCLLFTGKSFYFRAFASRGRPRGASSITIRPNSQLPEPDFHRQDTQHYGLRAENAEEKYIKLVPKKTKRIPKFLDWEFENGDFLFSALSAFSAVKWFLNEGGQDAGRP